jgi:glucosamine kinase
VSGDRTVIGIDIGGSKTHGVRVRGRRVEREAFAASANPSSVGLGEAGDQLQLLAAELVGPGDVVDAVCVGAAGVETPDAEERLRALVQRCLPGVPAAAVLVVHDTRLVLAAAGLAAGVVAISGTGSAAWGRTEAGDQVRAGGWGYILGDDGSGFGVVRGAIRHTLDRADAGAAPDALTRALLLACAVDSPKHLLERFYDSPSPREWAARADLVFELAQAHDEAAAKIVDDAGAELVRAVVRVSRRLGLDGPVVLAGGLALNQPLLQQTVRDGLKDHGLVDVRLLERDPVHGAVELALTHRPVPAGPDPHRIDPHRPEEA